MLFFLAIALLPSIVSAVGRAIVSNKCNHTVYLWSVGGSIGPKVVLPFNSSYSEKLHKDPKSGGVAIKMTSIDNGIFKAGVPQTIFAYNLDGAQVWYDMSDVFGDAFAYDGLEVKSLDSSCERIYWRLGVPPGGSQVKVCTSSKDVVMTFCPDYCMPAGSTCGPTNNKWNCCSGHCIGWHHCVLS